MVNTKITSTLFDLIIIGGGINGAGIARDASMRGMKTILFEKNDFAAGATGASSGLIHGGLKYLETDRYVTYKSCLDSGYIQQIAHHMLFRVPFIVPLKKNHPKGVIFLEMMETFFSAYDGFQKLKNGKKHIRLTPEETFQLHPGVSKDILGAVTMDEYGIDPFRLTILNIVAAKESNAEIMNHTEVISLIKEDGVVKGVEVFNKLKKERYSVYGKVVLNATGAWSPIFAKKNNFEVKMRPAKGVHLVIDRKISNYAVGTFSIDGRQVFVMPHENSTIIGTTDDDYYGDPDDIPITNDEVEYLLQAAENIIPDIRKHKVIRAFAGVRPTIFGEHCLEDQLSRDHELFDHKGEGFANLLSLIGGKLAAYRMISEEVTDTVAKLVGNGNECTTHTTYLPGSEATVHIKYLSKRYQMPLYKLERLYFRYGSRIMRILELMEHFPAMKVDVCDCEPVTEAEIRYVIRFEFARTVDDIRRRTRAGMGGCQGSRCSIMIGKILKEELGLTQEEEAKEISTFLQQRYSGNRPILKSKKSIQQMELNMANHIFLGGLESEY